MNQLKWCLRSSSSYSISYNRHFSTVSTHSSSTLASRTWSCNRAIQGRTRASCCNAMKGQILFQKEEQEEINYFLFIIFWLFLRQFVYVWCEFLLRTAFIFLFLVCFVPLCQKEGETLMFKFCWVHLIYLMIIMYSFGIDLIQVHLKSFSIKGAKGRDC